MTRPTLEISLPYPPTVNTYYRHVGGKVLISKAGRAYRKAVAAELRIARARPVPGRLAVWILVNPPDRRTRDLDNLFKGLLDALKHGGAFDDDGQIDRLMIDRGNPVKGGRAVVLIGQRKARE